MTSYIQAFGSSQISSIYEYQTIKINKSFNDPSVIADFGSNRMANYFPDFKNASNVAIEFGSDRDLLYTTIEALTSPKKPWIDVETLVDRTPSSDNVIFNQRDYPNIGPNGLNKSDFGSAISFKT